VSSTFSEDNSVLTVIFDVPPTYDMTSAQQSAQQCQIFSQATKSQLGSNPTCVWKNDTVLEVVFGPGYSLSPGDSIDISMEKVVTNSSQAVRQGSMARVTTGANSHQQHPQAVISAPSTIGPCDNLVLDGSMSVATGSSITFQWSYLGSEKDLTDLAAATSASNLIVPAAMIPVGEVSFSLKVSNSLGLISRETLHLTTKTTVLSPVLQIPSPHRRFYANPAVDLIYRAQIRPPCVSDSTLNLTTRAFWTQLFSTDTLKLALNDRPWAAEFSSTQLSLTNPDSVHLFVWNNSMIPGEVYGFQCVYETRVVDTNQLIAVGNKTIVIDADVAPVKAVIAGGFKRDIPFGESLKLDASASHDAAYPGSQVSYEWTVTNLITHQHVQVPAGQKTSSVLDFSSLSPVVGVQYTASVTVTGVRGRTSVATVEINTKSTSGPSVAISIVQGYIGTSEKLNVDSKLVLEAKTTHSDTTFSWSCTSHVVNFTALDISHKLHTGLTSSKFILGPNSLSAGAVYIFAVTATRNGLSSVSAVQIALNFAPSTGTCGVSPSSGLSLTTEFSFRCEGWVDSDGNLPLMFKFQELTRTMVGPSVSWIDLCEFRLKNSYSTQLFGAADGLTTVEISTRAQIRDAIGGMTTAPEMSVEIQAASTSLSWEKEFERSERLAEGDTERFILLQRARAHEASVGQKIRMIVEMSAVQSIGSPDVEDNVHIPLEFLREIMPSMTPVPTQSVQPQRAFSGELFQGITLSASERLSVLSIINSAVESPFRVPGKTTMDSQAITDSLYATGTMIAMFDGSLATIEEGVAISNDALVESNAIQKSLQLTVQSMVMRLEPGELADQRDNTYIRVVAQATSSSNVGGKQLGIEGMAQPLKLSPSLTFNGQSNVIRVGVVEVPFHIFPSSPLGWVQKSGVTAVWMWRDAQLLQTSDTAASSSYQVHIPGRVGDAVQETNSVLSFGQILVEPSSTVLSTRTWDSSSAEWSEEAAALSGSSETAATRSAGEYLGETGSVGGFYAVFSGNRALSAGGNRADFTNAQSSAASTLGCVVYVLVIFLALMLCLIYCVAVKANEPKDRRPENFWRDLNKVRLHRLTSHRNMRSWLMAEDWAFRRRHPWISVWKGASYDYLTPVKRLIVLTTSIMLALLLAAVFIILLTPEGTSLDLTAVLLAALISLIILIPFPRMFHCMYYRKVPTPLRLRVAEESRIPGSGCKKWSGVFLGVTMSEVAAYKAGHQYNDIDMSSMAMRVQVEKQEKGGLFRPTGGRSSIENVSKIGKNGWLNDSALVGEKKTDRSFKQSTSRTLESDHPSLPGSLPTTARAGAPDLAAILSKEKRNIAPLSGRSEWSEHKTVSDTWSPVRSAEMNLKSAEKSKDPNRTCCGLGADNDEYDTKKWTKQDKLSTFILLLIVIGCMIALFYLSPWLCPLVMAWMCATFLCLLSDFLCRYIHIKAVEAGLLKPCGSKSSRETRLNQVVGTSEEDLAEPFNHENPKSSTQEKLTFVPGDTIGFRFKGLRVEYVEDNTQAAQQGMCRGGEILAINGQAVHTDDEAEQALQDAHRTEGEFSIIVDNANVKDIDRKHAHLRRVNLVNDHDFSDIQITNDDLLTGRSGVMTDRSGFTTGRTNFTDIERKHTRLSRVLNLNIKDHTVRVSPLDDDDKAKGRSMPFDGENGKYTTRSGVCTTRTGNFTNRTSCTDIERRHVILPRVPSTGGNVSLDRMSVVASTARSAKWPTEDIHRLNGTGRAGRAGRAGLINPRMPLVEAKGDDEDTSSEDLGPPKRALSSGREIQVRYNVGQSIDFKFTDAANVSRIRRLGKAAYAGVSPGMFITHVNGERVHTAGEIHSLIRTARKQRLQLVFLFSNSDDDHIGDVESDTTEEELQDIDTNGKVALNGQTAKLS